MIGSFFTVMFSGLMSPASEEKHTVLKITAYVTQIASLDIV